MRWFSVARARRILHEQPITENKSDNPNQLLVDISVICTHDPGTGIQRVTHGIMEVLLSSSFVNYRVRLVAAKHRQEYRYITWNRADNSIDLQDRVSVSAGDIFLGLDFATHAIARNHLQLASWKKNGVNIYIVLHDLLPVRHPEWFSSKGVTSYRRWIKSVAILADAIVCFSYAVGKDFKAWCNECYNILPGSIPVHVIPMGWVSTETRSKEVPFGFEKKLSTISAQRSALIVGTIEPRKGHAQVLDAFEYLWKQGKNYILVIVGRPGWKTEALQKKLLEHPEYDHRLFWFNNASDEALHSLYKACKGVIVASYAEGFGIPLIEALGHGKPVLTRDLPVFREREQQGIKYFTANEGKTLAGVIEDWIVSIPAEHVIPSGLYSWNESTAILLKTILPSA